MSLLSVTLALFLIMDPLGNVSSYLSLVDGIDPKKQKYIVIREMLIALATMIVFNYLGEVIFSVLHLSETTVRIASGVILFLIAIKIIFPAPDSLRANLPNGEPFVIPLAIPLIAGPSLLATILLYANLEPSQPIMLAAILLAWLGAVSILLCARFFQRVLTNNGLMACERLMGMVLILLAIQRFGEGIQQFVALYAT